MFFVLKTICLAVYALAIAGLAGLLPSGLAGTMQTIALVMLMVHAVELLVMFKHVKRYPGPLAVSVLLTMLFGLLHWKPLADAAQKG
jgi:uncharacterized protein YhhL (DUF1145 family)